MRLLDIYVFTLKFYHRGSFCEIELGHSANHAKEN